SFRIHLADAERCQVVLTINVHQELDAFHAAEFLGVQQGHFILRSVEASAGQHVIETNQGERDKQDDHPPERQRSPELLFHLWQLLSLKVCRDDIELLPKCQYYSNKNTKGWLIATPFSANQLAITIL